MARFAVAAQEVEGSNDITFVASALRDGWLLKGLDRGCGWQGRSFSMGEFLSN